jgi:molybdopterin molybdotransferase
MASRPWESVETMIGVDEARERILARFSPLPPVALPIADALGLVLAESVVAEDAVPPFRNSAMDGFAVRSGDSAIAADDQPCRLPVRACLAAGEPPMGAIQPGTAARIMTGAPLPGESDAVIRFEEVEELKDEILLRRPARSGENVREAGEDIAAGATALVAGTSLGPAEIGVLAAVNRTIARVHRRPRVAILSTGNEVAAPGEALQPGQIRDSNSYLLAAAVRAAGGEPILLGIARDVTEDLTAKLDAVPAPDLYITSGGVSVGDYDMVKDVLRARGRIDLWQVRMKPGKPLAFGMLGETPLLGLPGNPVAALVSFEQFGRPAIRTMLGFRDVCLPELDAELAHALDNVGQRRHFVRGLVEGTSSGLVARAVGAQGSAILSSVAQANCFIVVPETCPRLEAGARVRVQAFNFSTGAY